MPIDFTTDHKELRGMAPSDDMFAPDGDGRFRKVE